ncbi:MAG: extracellular solute-binding protein [Rhodocyclaceae bacterium]|nr:extracellular solute-binding protein [Rhodocyclaceae bacterium]
MPHLIRTAAIACGLAVAFSAHAAKPAKPTKAAKTTAAASAGPVEIDLANQLGQAAEGRLQQLVERFNHEQKDFVVKLVPLAEGGKPAALNLVRRQDMADFLSQKGRLKPLYQVMSEAKVPFSAASLSTDLKAGVSDEKGKLVALPVAYSTPVLFYNKAAFRKAGLDPEKPPKTWWEMQETAGKLFDAGYQCPYTSSWPTWVHVDNLSALSSAPVATAKGELVFNGLAEVKHVAMLASWTKAKYFRHFGRRDEADKHFASGECAMITTDSAAHTEFREASGIDLGVSPMPHHDDVYGGRQHTLADGASLWVGGGYKPLEYKAAARFVAFLMAPESQVELARMYGQVPLTQAARNALKAKVVQDRDPTSEVAYASLKGEGGQPQLRVSAIDPVRAIVDEELEAVWDDQKPAKAALDTAVARGNALLSAKPALKKAVPF